MILSRSLVLCSALFLATPALADLSGMITGNDRDRVFELTAAYGPVERETDDNGFYLRATLDGIIYTISFLNCDDAGLNCTTVQFRAWWNSEGSHTVDEMNQWNIDRRFSAAYLDDRGNATIEWDVNLAGGVTAVNFDDSLQWWHTVLREFRDTVIEGGAPPGGGTASK